MTASAKARRPDCGARPAAVTGPHGCTDARRGRRRPGDRCGSPQRRSTAADGSASVSAKPASAATVLDEVVAPAASVPRPEGSRPDSATIGEIRRGCREAVEQQAEATPVANPAGAAARRRCCDRSRSRSAGPPAPACLGDAGTIASTGRPQPSNAAATEPADVPTTRPHRGRRDRCTSSSADSAPSIQAKPSTPPAPSTIARRGVVLAHAAVPSTVVTMRRVPRCGASTPRCRRQAIGGGPASAAASRPARQANPR